MEKDFYKLKIIKYIAKSVRFPISKTKYKVKGQKADAFYTQSGRRGRALRKLTKFSFEVTVL